MPALLTAQNVTDRVYLVVGFSTLTISRIRTIVEHGAIPVVVGFDGLDETARGKLSELEVENLTILDSAFDLNQLSTVGRKEIEGYVDGVFVTISGNSDEKVKRIYESCKRQRIPINVADSPQYCTFTLLSTFSNGDFQLGVTTNGKGCRLANRIRREAVKNLPPNMDQVCEKVGELRRKIYMEDQIIEHVGQEDDDAAQSQEFNNLVLENDESAVQKKKQRLRWLSQIVEYYPLEKLSSISVEELSKDYRQSLAFSNHSTSLPSIAEKGRISLVGSGPGSSGLLTNAAIHAITTADIILADKLVPEEVLSLIPRKTPVKIAKKFPGNAERAQEELLQLGLEGLQAGLYVVRLKQGDPYIFGRGAEEFNYFREHGYTPDVISGITSALNAPLVARIPPTHREVADQVLICTGTGRKGALPTIPEWVSSRTCVFLMALHRIEKVVTALEEKGWDLDVPCCVIERSSCPDQRVIRTRLKYVAEALEFAGSRPPGLLVTGYACEVIEKLPEGEKWVIEEGFEASKFQNFKNTTA